MANTCVDCKEVEMSNQTFEEKLDNLIFEAVESAASYSHKVSAEEADYIQSSLKQAIIKLIEEEVSNKIIGGNYSVLQYRIDDADQQRNIGKNELVAEQRRALDKLIKGE